MARTVATSMSTSPGFPYSPGSAGVTRPKDAMPGGLGRAGPGAGVERPQRTDGGVEVSLGQAGPAADPEGVGGDELGDVEGADHAVLDALVGRLAQEVAGEQLARGDPVRLQVADQVALAVRRVGADRDREAEPGRPRPGRGLG